MLTLDARLTRESTQVLAVGLRVQSDEFVERLVIAFEQAVAPLFDAMQGRGFAADVVAVVIERGADGVDVDIVELAHLLGEELGLPLARDLLRHRARTPHLFEEIVAQRDLAKLGIGQIDQRLRELEHVQRLAAQLATAGALVVLFRPGWIEFVLADLHITDNSRSNQGTAE